VPRPTSALDAATPDPPSYTLLGGPLIQLQARSGLRRRSATRFGAMVELGGVPVCETSCFSIPGFFDRVRTGRRVRDDRADISHQWFGDMVTMALVATTCGLNEGFRDLYVVTVDRSFSSELRVWLHNEPVVSPTWTEMRAPPHPIVTPIRSWCSPMPPSMRSPTRGGRGYPVTSLRR